MVPRNRHSLFSLSRLTFLLFCFIIICVGLANKPIGRSPLEEILRSNRQQLKPVIKHPDRYRLQIIYTQIDRDAQNNPSFTTYRFHQNDQLYFYPASSVKMPTAFLALEKINNLQTQGLNRETPMFTNADRVPQTSVTQDTTAANGMPSVAQYIRKIFAVSDNDAYNRLYEFVGQRALNQTLYAKGFGHTRITCRLDAPQFLPIDNQITNGIYFKDHGQIVFSQGQVQSQWVAPDLHLNDELQGIGSLDQDGEFINQPFDFSQKNYISLQTLHDILKAVMFPESVPENQQFNFTQDDYRFLYRCMGSYPRELAHPHYDPSRYPDHYVKFLGYGDGSSAIPPYVRIFNKVGDAYGYLTDVSYVVDFKHNVEYFLAATLMVNANGIFNDGVYEYDTIGFPFMAHLGQAVYQYELSRPRTYPPDLSRFEVND